MKAAAALKVIRECIDEERVVLKDHFVQRMAERGMFWSDVLAIIEDAGAVRTDGRDHYDRERWFITGDAPDGLQIEILCVIDETDPMTFS